MLISMRYDATMSESWQNRQHREILEVKTAIESFPDEFGLYGYENCVFKIAPMPCSYYSNSVGVQLVVQIWSTKETWMDFGRFSPTELRGRLL